MSVNYGKLFKLLIDKKLSNADLVKAAGISANIITRLKKDEYISVDDDGYIAMMPKGKQFAEQLYERHTVLTNMLISLGVDEETATEDACRIEHVISDKSFNAVKKHYAEFSTWRGSPANVTFPEGASSSYS